MIIIALSATFLLLIQNSKDIHYLNNTLLNYFQSWMEVISCHSVTIQSNLFLNISIELQETQDAIFSDNVVLFNGLSLTSSNNNTIEKNLFAFSLDFAFSLNLASNNVIRKNNFYNMISGIKFYSSKNNTFNKNYFHYIAHLLLQSADVTSNSNFNLFIENSFLDKKNTIELGNNYEMFDNGSVGNYWKSNSETTDNYLVYMNDNKSLKIYDNYPLKNISYEPDQTLLNQSENQYNKLRSMVNLNQVPPDLHFPTEIYTYVLTYLTSPYVSYSAPSGSQIPTINPSSAITSKSTTQKSVTTKSSLPSNDFIIAILVIIGVIAIGYTYYVKNYNENERRNIRLESNNFQTERQQSNNNIRNQTTLRTPKNCPKCRMRAEPGDKFCYYCGQRLI